MQIKLICELACGVVVLSLFAIALPSAVSCVRTRESHRGVPLGGAHLRHSALGAVALAPLRLSAVTP